MRPVTKLVKMVNVFFSKVKTKPTVAMIVFRLIELHLE